MRLLDKIKKPEDLKQLDLPQLKQVAEEIRQLLVQVTAENGGHLAPNLGVVELTLAMHYVYQTPEDKIVWDVGHQAYVHKILTGRYDEFKTIRTLGGLSGFPKRGESEHDAFDTGHSSTSISAAVGFAKARDIKKEDHEVIAVIGDGAMTGGMAFEALNHGGHLKSKLTVILNDNEMSIAPNVGAMSEYLNKVRTDPNYTKGKEDVELVLNKIPNIGPAMVRVADRIKDSFKTLLVPGAWFEELGFKYVGPVNGHDLAGLIAVLENAKRLNRPVLIHIISQKGKGYLPAEKNPDLFHGIGAFDIATGTSKGKKVVPTYTDIFSKTLIRLGEEDSRIVGVTAAMGQGTGVSKFAEQFPERAFDVGIAEQHGVTMAAAMALDGLKPVVAIYSTFLQRAYDQVLHDLALQEAPVILALDRAGLVGEDGPTHHGVYDIAYLRHIPNMVLMAPKDENELQHMMYTATKLDLPTAIRYPRGSATGIALDNEFKELPIGKSEIINLGTDITLVSIGTMFQTAHNVKAALEQAGLSVGLINGRFVKPLDQEAIRQASESKLLVTLEEHQLEGGFGSAVLECLNDLGITTEVLRIGVGDEFIPHGNTKMLKKLAGLDDESVVQKVLEKLSQLK